MSTTKPNGTATVMKQDNATRPHLREAKRVARRAKSESGVTYEQIAEAVEQRTVANVYDMLSEGDDKRHLRYGDLIAMSQRTHTKVFVEALLEPLTKNLKGF